MDNNINIIEMLRKSLNDSSIEIYGEDINKAITIGKIKSEAHPSLIKQILGKNMIF